MKIPTDLKDMQQIREFLTNVRTQVCGLADYLSEPWKTHFTDLKKQYDDTLAALPPTDAVPAALESNHPFSAFFSLLANASALVSMLGTQLNSLQVKQQELVSQGVATALNSAVDVELTKRLEAGELVTKAAAEAAVTAAIEARTQAGELVPKETVTQLCSEARGLGVTEGEKKVREEIAAAEARAQTIGARKAALQQCGLPVPDLDGLLGGTEEEFTAAQKLAEERINGLRSKGVAINSQSPLAMKVWLPKEQYEVFESLALETLKGDPLVTPATKATTPGKEFRIVV